jgi:CO dehydrogenase maturation factor
LLHATVRGVIEVAPQTALDACILDTEASLEHLTRGTAFFADAMLVVVEPHFKSLEAARRTARLASDLGLRQVALIANKVRVAADMAIVRELAAAEGIGVAGMIPFDERLPDADRVGAAPLDHAPDAPAVAAIGELGRALMARAEA